MDVPSALGVRKVVAGTPLNVTDDTLKNPVPFIVTVAPAGALVGLKLVMVGCPKNCVLVPVPPTAWTVTWPAMFPSGISAVR
jgi:hypothetical protein